MKLDFARTEEEKEDDGSLGSPRLVAFEQKSPSI